jgi:hypothetical protein
MRLCGGALEVADPEAVLVDYLDPRHETAYPDYDALVTNGSPALVDSDLLAPALLNAPVDRVRFRLLQSMLPRLAAVAELPQVPLQEASDDDVEAVAALYEVLDDERFRRGGVRGTILAKVLHRKRPDLVPLYDSVIFEAYTRSVIDRLTERSWVEFMRRLCLAMRADLRAHRAEFDHLVEVTRTFGTELTPLRILDILVWRTESEWL